MSERHQDVPARNSPCIFLSPLTDSICEMMAVRHLLFFSPETARLYLGALNERSASLILESLMKSKPPFLIPPPQSDLTVSNFHWECFCVDRWLNSEAAADFSPFQLYKGVLRGQRTWSSLLKILDDASNVFGQYKDAETVLSVFNECPALYYALESKLFPSVSSCGSKLFKQYSFPALNVSNVPADEIEFANIDDVMEFFSVPAVYYREDFAVKVQNNFFMKNRFPNVSFVGGGSVLASIFNTAAASQVHLVDVVTREAIKEFENGDAEKGIERLKLFPELVNYAVFAVLHRKLNDLTWVNQVLPRVLASKITLVADLAKRIDNDVSFLVKVKQLTGSITSSQDLEDYSIARLLLPVLKSDNYQVFDEVRETPMLTVSDVDRIFDCDFANAFHLISCVLDLASEKQQNLDLKIEHIRSRLELMTRKPGWEGFFVDIFSLLFLKRNDKYVFNIECVEQIVLVLSTHVGDRVPGFEEILRDALQRVQILKILASDDSLEIMFSSPENLFLEAVAKNEIGVAERIAATRPECQKLITAMKEIKNYEATKSWQGASTRGIDEIALCHVNTNEMPVSESIRKIIDNRLTSPLDLVQIDNVQSYVVKLTKTSSVNWPPTERLDNAPIFNGFFEYLDSIFPILLNSKIGTTLADALSHKPWTLVSLLIKVGDIGAAKKIGAIFGVDIVESLILYGNANDTWEAIAKYPVVRVAQGIMSQSDTEGDSDVVRRFKKLSDQEQFKIISSRENQESSTRHNLVLSGVDHIDSSQVADLIADSDFRYEGGLSQRTCSDLLEKLLVEKPMQKDIVIDLAYRSDMSVLDDLLERVMSFADLESLYEVCCEVNFSFAEKLNVLRKIRDMGINPFPLKQAFQELVSRSYYEEATEFAIFFRYVIDAKNVLRNEALKLIKNNESIRPVLDVIPKLRKEILESLPGKYRTHTQQEFFDSVPEEWVRHETEDGTLWRNHHDTENVRMLLERFPQITIDKEILGQVSSVARILDNPIVVRIGEMMNGLTTFMPLMRNKSELLQLVCRELFLLLDKVNIEDCSGEALASVFVNKIVMSLNECQRIRNSMEIKSVFCDNLDVICEQVKVLRDFLMKWPSSKYDAIYSFENFTKQACGEKILELCYQYDFLELADRICKAWKVTSGAFADEYSMKVYSLGITNEFSDDRRHKLSERTLSIVKRYVQLFSHPSFYDHKFIREFSVVKIESYMMEFRPESLDDGLHGFTSSWKSKPKQKILGKSMSLDTEHLHELATREQPHFYHRLTAICNATIPFNITRELLKSLKHYLKNKAPVIERVCYFTTAGNYEKALKCFNAITEIQNKWDTFRDGIFIPALSHNYLARFRYRIAELGVSAHFQPFFEKLLRLAIKRDMFVLMYELQLFLGRTDEAVRTAVRLSEQSDNAKVCCKYVEMAETAARLDLRNQNRTSERVVSRESIEKYAELLPLQRRFFQYCQKNNGNVATFNLFHGPSVAAAMTALLFKDFECEFAVEMMSKCELNPIDVANKLLDILANEGDVIMSFFEKFEEKAGDLFHVMVPAMIRRMATFDSSRALSLVGVIADHKLKCLLLIELGKLEEAYSVAKKEKVYAVIPLIGREAIRHGNASLVSMVQSHTVKLDKKKLL